MAVTPGGNPLPLSTPGPTLTPAVIIGEALAERAREGQRQTRRQQPTRRTRPSRAALFQATEGRPQRLPRQQLLTRQIEEARRTNQPVNLTRGSVDNETFKEIVKGFVSGSLDAETLTSTGRPGSSVIRLSPARFQAKLREQARVKAEDRKLERLVTALETQRGRTIDSQLAPEQLTANIKGPIPQLSQTLNIRLTPRQREVVGLLRDAVTGNPVRDASRDAERALRFQIGAILKNRMPAREFREMLADLNWQDVFEREVLNGTPLDTAILQTPVTDTGEIVDPAIAQFVRRRQARRENQAAFAALLGAQPLISAQLPLRAVIRAAQTTTGRGKRAFARTLVNLIKEERGILDVDVQALKRGSGRLTTRAGQARQLEHSPTGTPVRVDPERVRPIPGKFDPDTFDPFRPLPGPDIPDDPLRVVRRQRRLTRVIEQPSDLPTTPTGETPAIVPATATPVTRTIRGPRRTPLQRPGVEPTGVPSVSPTPLETPQGEREITQAGQRTRPTPIEEERPQEEPRSEPQGQPQPQPEKPTPTKPPVPERAATQGRPPPPTRVPPRRRPDITLEPTQRRKSVPVRQQDLFINVVAWRQGNQYIIQNLVTGERRTQRSAPPGIRPGVTPRETLTVLELGPRRPSIQELDIGAFRIRVSQRNITFNRKLERATNPIPVAQRPPSQEQLDRTV